MRNIDDPETLTVDVVSPEKLASLRERFVAAWDLVRTGAVPPRIEDFLGNLTEPARSTLRHTLERVDAECRGADTVDRPLPAPGHQDPGGTVDVEAPPSFATGKTLNLPPAEKVDPAGTVDVRVDDTRPGRPGGHGGTVDFLPDSGGTIDQPARRDDDDEHLTSLPAPPLANVQELPSVAGYQILGILGRGAMGVVYKARQRGLQRIVALKMILAGGHASESEVARFRSEAEAVGQLHHPNIVQVYEVGEQDGCPFFSLEYVDGGSLNKKIGGEPQPVQPAAHLTMLLAHGMEAAHQKGIIHRDLKPANVMLTQPRPGGTSSDGSGMAVSLSAQLYGVPKIADFGLAKRLEEESGQTRSGTIIGTPSYMAPEQAEGRSKEVGPLADVYALGAVLYELLTGRAPFRGETMWDTLEQVRFREPVPPSQLQPKVPRDLETICLKCLQKEKSRRYPSAGALAEDLRRYLAGEPILARPVSPVERAWRWCRRNPVVAGLSALVFLSLAVGTIVATLFAIEASNRAEQLAEEQEHTEKQRQAAVAARDDARTKEAVAVAEKLRADQKEQVAVAQKLRAEQTKDAANLQREVAEKEFKRVIKDVQDKLQNTDGMSAQVRMLRMELLLSGAAGLEKIAEIASKNADLMGSESNLAKRARASTLLSLMQVYKDLNEGAKAYVSCQQACNILEELAHLDPRGGEARGNLAVAHLLMGDICLHMHQGARRAEKEFLQSIAIYQTILDDPGDGKLKPEAVRLRIAGLQGKLAYLTSFLGDPAQAKALYLANLAQYNDLLKAPGSRETLLGIQGSIYQSLADVSWRLGDTLAMADYQNQSLAIRKEQWQKAPNRPSGRRALALAYGSFGDGLLRLGRLDGAVGYYDQAHQLLLALQASDPPNKEYAYLLAGSHYRLATAALVKGNKRLAEQHFQQALRLYQDLYRSDPGPSNESSIMACLARCGDPVRAAALADKLGRVYAAMPEYLYPVACGYALCAEAVGEGDPRYGHYIARALDTLERAAPAGYKDVVKVQTDPELVVLRDRPEYQALIERLRK